MLLFDRTSFWERQQLVNLVHVPKDASRNSNMAMGQSRSIYPKTADYCQKWPISDFPSGQREEWSVRSSNRLKGQFSKNPMFGSGNHCLL